MEKKNYDYLCVYTFSYVALGALLPLLGQYLASIGFSGTQIGTITAAGTTASILTATFWGKRYSLSQNRKKFIQRLCLMAALVCILMLFTREYLLFLLLFGLMYVFQSPVLSLIDAMAIEDNEPFAAARKWGAIGFASAVFISGKICEALGLEAVFPLYSISFLICAAFVYRMSKKRGRGAAASLPKQDIRSEKVLFRNKKFVLILLCAFFMCGTNVANNTYFGFLFINGGGTVAGIGLAFLLMAGGEAPFMAWSKQLADRFTLEKTMLIAMCISVIRFSWYATEPSSTMLLALFFLQGMVNGIILVEFVRYIAKVVDQEHLGMAVSVYYGFGASLPTIICQLFGGIILDHFGPGGVYAFFATLNAAGVAVFTAAGLHNPPPDAQLGKEVSIISKKTKKEY